MALVRLVGATLLLLGIGIIAFPALAAPLFAMPPPDANDITYLRAIALRDLAIGAWLLLGTGISVRATTISLAAVALIPCGDIVLVAANGGGPLALLPHAISLASLGLLATWGARLS
jgi:hypothetical protein